MSRRAKYLFPICSLLAFASVPLIAMWAFAQTSSAQSRITQPVDETKLAVLRGNVHPLARAQFDRGAAPASLPMDHMLLVLQRSPQQEAALETLLAGQQDRSSPNYHRWLTPEQFGEQFGPSDQDIQTITTWLESHGFQVNEVSKGRTLIDFSGIAGQLQQAFHTAMHSYVLPDGRQHWANASDPKIPAALAPVVAGVNSLNDFRKKPMSHTVGVFQRSKATGKITRVSPQFTYQGGCNDNSNAGVTGTNCFAVGPADFAKIYNVPPNITGAGQTIAIVSDSDINASDVANFRSFFGLPPIINFRQIETQPSNDPGVLPNGDEGEAVLDVEWAGAVAPGAAIDLVVSPTTNSTFGGDTSAQYIVNLSPLPQILGYSYGECELFLGTSGNAFYQGLWSQAAGEGITVLVSTGDSGSADCDAYLSTNTNPVQPAVDGLAVNGIASTPFDVAVGGTDFNDFNYPSQTSTYWNSANTSSTQASAKGYIPEIAYNDSCTNSLIYTAFSDTTAEQGCNDPNVQSVTSPPLVTTLGGAGGVSNCTRSSTTSSTTNPDPSSCSGGYAKPSWQTGPGVPDDGKRDIPDVSLFAGDGTIQNFYIVCQSDQTASAGNAACSLTGPSTSFLGAGGTSLSTQTFAGVMALIDQKQGGSQGNINPLLYALAGEQAAASCNASSPASTCVFNDVTSGTIRMPCQTGSFNCTTLTSGDAVGVLTGFDAGTGYDLATGLGSVNVANLVNGSGPNFYLSSSNPVVTIMSAGGSGTLNLAAYAGNGFNGQITLACSGLPTGATCSFSPSSSVTPAPPPGGTQVTLTVNTTAPSMVGPADGSSRRSPPITSGEVTMALGLFLVILLASGLDKQRRWSAAVALVTLALFAGMAACGNGYGGGTSGGTPAPLVNLTPKSLTFANQNVGTASAAQTVTLTNIGTASMSITGISASGDFNESSNCGTTLGAAANCPIQVSFSPTATGTRIGTLTIQDNAAGSPRTVPLTGTAVSSGGAGNGGTPMGTSIVTVTGTASGGSPTFSMDFTLTIQ